MATTSPLKSSDEIEAVRAVLTTPRDHALFTLSINTAYRGGDLLTLNVGDVQFLKAGDTLTIREQKTSNRRSAVLNQSCIDALKPLIAGRGKGEPLFVGNKGTRLTISSYSRMYKDWCRDAGLRGNFASHSGRKSFGYLNRVVHGVGIEVLMKAYGHSRADITMTYLCVQDNEVAALYDRNF